MIKLAAEKLASIPWVYNTIQTLAGVRRVRARAGACVGSIEPTPSLIVDVGGATGTMQDFLPAGLTYVCLDFDVRMVRDYRKTSPGGGLGIASDATRMGLMDACADVLLVTSVLHHLSGEQALAFMVECRRVLKPEGRLVLLDPLWMPRRLVSRLLWRYDRGSFPRDPEAIRSIIEREFTVLEWDQFRPLHDFVLCLGAKK